MLKFLKIHSLFMYALNIWRNVIALIKNYPDFEESKTINIFGGGHFFFKNEIIKQYDDS